MSTTKTVAEKSSMMKNSATPARGAQDLSIFALPQLAGRKKGKAAARGKVAVIYTRVSTKEQAETNQSLETQLERCRAYADRHGYEVAGEFGGTYESAKNDERKEFQKMLDFVKKSRHKVGYILVYSTTAFPAPALVPSAS